MFALLSLQAMSRLRTSGLSAVVESSPISLDLVGELSVWLVVCGSVCAAVMSVIWALLERSERRASQAQNSKLSLACQSIIEQHYRERLQTEERHLLSYDSAVRNILEHLERALLGKPKP